MTSQTVHVLFVLVATFWISNACEYNDCICYYESVFCEVTDMPTPLFSEDEVLQIVLLQITPTQVDWFHKKCHEYPRLQHIVMGEGYQCSRLFCVPCTTVDTQHRDSSTDDLSQDVTPTDMQPHDNTLDTDQHHNAETELTDIEEMSRTQANVHEDYEYTQPGDSNTDRDSPDQDGHTSSRDNDTPSNGANSDTQSDSPDTLDELPYSVTQESQLNLPNRDSTTSFHSAPTTTTTTPTITMDHLLSTINGLTTRDYYTTRTTTSIIMTTLFPNYVGVSEDKLAKRPKLDILSETDVYKSLESTEFMSSSLLKSGTHSSAIQTSSEITPDSSSQRTSLITTGTFINNTHSSMSETPVEITSDNLLSMTIEKINTTMNTPVTVSNDGNDIESAHSIPSVNTSLDFVALFKREMKLFSFTPKTVKNTETFQSPVKTKTVFNESSDIPQSSTILGEEFEDSQRVTTVGLNHTPSRQPLTNVADPQIAYIVFACFSAIAMIIVPVVLIVRYTCFHPDSPYCVSAEDGSEISDEEENVVFLRPPSRHRSNPDIDGTVQINMPQNRSDRRRKPWSRRRKRKRSPGHNSSITIPKTLASIESVTSPDVTSHPSISPLPSVSGTLAYQTSDSSAAFLQTETLSTKAIMHGHPTRIVTSTPNDSLITLPKMPYPLEMTPINLTTSVNDEMSVAMLGMSGFQTDFEQFGLNLTSSTESLDLPSFLKAPGMSGYIVCPLNLNTASSTESIEMPSFLKSYKTPVLVHSTEETELHDVDALATEAAFDAMARSRSQSPEKE